MKKLFFCLVLTGLFVQFTSAQTATLHISVANTSNTEFYLWIPAYGLSRDFLGKGRLTITLDKQKKGLYTASLTEPLSITLFCDADSTRKKSLTYNFFVTPGDDIYFKADFNKKDYGITVTGKGANNNQPLLALDHEVNTEQFYGDTLPYRLINAVNEKQVKLKNALNQYVSAYKLPSRVVNTVNEKQVQPKNGHNKQISEDSPSAAFIKFSQNNLAYYAPQEYYWFKENNKFRIREAYKRNFAKWQRVNDSLFASIKLNNDDALGVHNYLTLLRDFLGRQKEQLWTERNENPANFYKQWYNTNIEEGKKLFDDDMTNVPQEKIIHKYFTGKTAEYAYALLFDGSLKESNPANLIQIFERFKKQYPQSKYIAWFAPSIDDIAKREQQALSKDMVFVDDNGTKLNTLNDILALTKGKTILLDMWGTWCGPCRSEIESNSHAIKAYFKDKGLDYLYIANSDLQHEKKWKELIAYFDLKGTHILANKSLSADIMDKVNGTGYPTYVIIKKDGTYEKSKAGYPMKREVLIKQLEAALTK